MFACFAQADVRVFRTRNSGQLEAQETRHLFQPSMEAPGRWPELPKTGLPLRACANIVGVMWHSRLSDDRVRIGKSALGFIVTDYLFLFLFLSKGFIRAMAAAVAIGAGGRRAGGSVAVVVMAIGIIVVAGAGAKMSSLPTGTPMWRP
jgi:hypothetical protein